MNQRPLSRSIAPASLVALALLAGCGKVPSQGAVVTAPTPLTHRLFPIAVGVHAVDCAVCHKTTYASFKQFDCVGCHVAPPTAAVHTTTVTPPNYLTDSTSCYGCHADPTTHPFDHVGIDATHCATCHGTGAFYAALPKPGFTHLDAGTTDCYKCHVTATWLNASGPPGLSSDPAAAVSVNALVATYSGTSIVTVSAQVDLLPMEMDHASTAVNMAGLACSICHNDANAGVFFPGRLHSSLANRAQPAPTTCIGCHVNAEPVGFVGPTATSPGRTPSSGEMKHDAVVWVGGAPTATRVVRSDCGVCHVSPTATLAATWGTGTTGTAPARLHASLATAGLPQPTSCVDCHANTRPIGPQALTGGNVLLGLTFDHAGAGATGDCGGCHASTTAWNGARFHLAGSPAPTSCLPCHAGQRPVTNAGWTSATYATSPFDYGTNAAGITHGDGQDCAGCHGAPGTGGFADFTGGAFSHGAATVAASTCIACHMSQRPDLVMGQATAATALGGFDHASWGTGDCIGCHRATVTRGVFVSYYGAAGAFPGGDWRGAATYPGNQLVSAPNRFVTVTEISLTRAAPGALVTGMTSIQDTLYNAMLHTSDQVPAVMSPGTSPTGDPTTCWHCHAHPAGSIVVSDYTQARYHASLSSYQANLTAPVTPLAQPSLCLDCHAQMRPPNVVELGGSDLRPMDHAALFTATVSIAGQAVSGVGGLDCATCHHNPGVAWSDGVFHASIGAAVPADCTACHYPLMADAPAADLVSTTAYAMKHRSAQLRFQTCTTCHTSALASATTSFLSTAWRPGAFHASVPTQPSACVDCHAVSAPPSTAPTQSSWSYLLPLGGTASNGGQWMNHGAAPVVGKDCAACHAADATSAVTVWSKATQFHVAVLAPAGCQGCHGLTNGGGAVAGTNNNLPVGLTNSSTLTTASANAVTGVPAGTYDQITHADANVTGHDCSFCHTQYGRSTLAGIQGVEWAQARFHARFTAATPLVINGTTGRCSNCHLNVRPAAGYAPQDHTGFTATPGTQDCSSCHSWPGTGGVSAPNWLGGGNMPQFIVVGGFSITQPPATAPTTQTGITNLPHPTPPPGAACTTCHAASGAKRPALGYDHASALINANCSACHEAGSNLVTTLWNGATSEGAGAGDTRPYTLTKVVAQKGGIGGPTCTITSTNHFYPVQCGQCHASPAGDGLTTTGAAYAAAWYFPHATKNMTNPATCNLCHVGQNCGM